MSEFCVYPEVTTLEIEEETIHCIVTELSSLLPGNLRTIDEGSEELFYRFVQSSPIDRSAFSYNWPYVVQATRKHGFYYQNQQSIIYFYFRKTEDLLQPYTLIVVNHLGEDPEDSVCELAEAAKKLSILTIVKNVDQNKILVWNNLGFKETIKPWSRYSLRDDNTFPEFVYDVKRFLNLQFTPHTRSIINKFSREMNCVFVSYDHSFRCDGLNLLDKNSEYLESKGVDFRREVVLAHQFVFDDSIINKIVFAILENSVLLGISCLTHFEENLFFNAIISENKSNLMRFILWKSVAHYCEGLEEHQRPLYLALQGSENEGQNNWKRFFHPIRAIHRTHVTNDW